VGAVPAASPSAGFPLLQLLILMTGFIVRHDEIEMASAERSRKIVNAYLQGSIWFYFRCHPCHRCPYVKGAETVSRPFAG
jgi:hypothetical protein